jgi:hypothetical protein
MPKHTEDQDKSKSNVAFNAMVQPPTDHPPEPPPPESPPPPPAPAAERETTVCGELQPPCVPLSLQTVLLGIGVAYLVGLATGVSVFSGVQVPDLE